MLSVAEDERTGRSAAVLVIQPDPAAALDRFGTWLSEGGVGVRVLRPFRGDPLPATVDSGGLIVLGGRTSLVGEDEYPWLADARALLRHAVETEVPVLGICLGAQMLAQATGGTVATGESGTELGVVEVELTAACRQDSLFSGAPEPFLAGSFHSDAVAVLPPEGTLLGSTAMYAHQMFRVGDCAWGVQFHPEISAGRYLTWRDLGRDRGPAFMERFTRGHADLIRHDEQIVRASSWLARRFAHIVRLRVSV